MRTPFRAIAVLALLVLCPGTGLAQLLTPSTPPTITANGGTAEIQMLGVTSATVTVSGTWVGTLQFEGTGDGSNWTALTLTKQSDLSTSTSTTANGTFWVPNPGLTSIRVRASAWTSGTATITAARGYGVSAGGGGSSSSVSITQGGNTAAVNASSQLSVTCANCSGTGVSANEDSAFADGNAVTPAGAVRQDTIASSTSADGDVTSLKSDSVGRLYTTGAGGTFPATQSGTWTVQPGNTANTTAWLVTGTGGTFPVTQGTAANLNATVVGTGTFSVQTSAQVPGTGATNLGKAEDAAAASGDTGVALLVLREDTPTSTASASGDYIMPKADSVGRLFVNCATGCSGGTQFAEDAAHASGDSGTVALVVRADTAAASSGTTGDYDALHTDSTGRLWANTELPDAAALADDTANPTVPSVAAMNMCFDGTTWDRCRASALTEATEDAAETAAGVGTYAMTVRRDTAASSAGTTGDNATLNTNNVGALWVAQVDPCSSEAKITAPFSLTARGVVISATASKKNYICAIVVVAGAAEIFNLVEGTGTTCQTGTAALIGSTTAANGLSFAANGGMSAIGSNSSVIAGLTANVDTCIVPSSTNRLAGFVTYVQR